VTATLAQERLGGGRAARDGRPYAHTVVTRAAAPRDAGTAGSATDATRASGSPDAAATESTTDAARSRAARPVGPPHPRAGATESATDAARRLGPLPSARPCHPGRAQRGGPGPDAGGPPVGGATMTGPPRVALVLDRLDGGPARAALTAALALDGQTYAHTVIVGATGALDAWAAENGVEVVHAHGPRKLVEAVGAGAYDVVHTHEGTTGRIAAARAGVPRVVHTWYSPPRPTLAERRAARCTDMFLVVGTRTAARALRSGLASPERLRAVWPAVALPGRPGTRTRARRLLELPLGARVVGGIGPAYGARRPDVFARAIARLPADVYGVWADGDGGPGGLGRRLTERLGGERLIWLGRRDDFADLLPGFDVLAMTGRHEGVPYAAVHAAAAGVPLVGTVAPSGPDIIRAGETGLLTAPGDPGQLATAVGHLLDNPAEARRMSRAALDRVADRCSPQSLSATLDLVYRRPSPAN
jgi:glycosyltransferase involved in cell wall biosynthesis